MVATEADIGRSPVSVIINGRRAVLDAAPGERLLDVLRRSGYLEIKEGCGEGECGSCTILLDGRAICSCLALAQSVDGAEILTVAATENRTIGALHDSFVEEMGTQCGFCTPGMVLSAAELLSKASMPGEEQVKDALSGNLCRCTGYSRIVKAVERAAEALSREEQ